MIDIVNIELINTTENYLLDIFSVNMFFYQLDYSWSTPVSCGQDQGV